MAFLDSIFGFLGKNAATIGYATQAVSAITSYIDTNNAAKQTKKANAAMMKAAETEAALTRQDAAVKADTIRRDAMRLRSQQIASYLKSGVTLDGSPMLVTDETKAYGELDAQNTMTNADYSARAMLLRAEGNKQAVKKADFFTTAFDVLGSTAKAADAYKKTHIKTGNNYGPD